ncbi:MAG: GDCCVxC domain-containing (seleno)protein [Segetibacter sp.]
MEKTIIPHSTITCPSCGYRKTEMMPGDACLFFYVCENCKTRLKPKQGDCCVFCSYGTVKCPPMQQDSDSCCR